MKKIMNFHTSWNTQTSSDVPYLIMSDTTHSELSLLYSLIPVAMVFELNHNQSAHEEVH